MKQEKFINVLKKVIHEEVRSVIKEELTEIIKKGLEKDIRDLNESQVQEPTVTSTRNTNIKFNKNKFSDILNNTDKLAEKQSVGDYASLMSEDIIMTSKNAQGFNAMRQMNNNITTMQDPESGKSLKVDPIVAKAMTRDYSALMKAIDNKRK